ncbi:SDR family oxidoreductase [Spongiibacter sp. KMU-166]|uniref:SDR family oxidoreductase n=1 Tax=Spongiibacter thalassae TaxID=2721624 RepID=A0ABX1GIK8_9GAMM|nr:SDR family oxidoreductase [Spongiibacter thalassae]NKI18024.1 SDR family oxidoreductase [Spongiibacter thalassae]
MSEKRVFITGGASGLGKALAECFAKEGYAVCIGDINDERGLEAETELLQLGKAKYLHCNVQQESDLQSAADWLKQEWGGVDIVINNAGVATAGTIDGFSLDDWQWVMDINVLGVVRGCKVFTPLLREQGGGQLVNIASLAGLIHPPKMSSYCATKAAVVALSETLSIELDRDNIAVSVVCPSFFRTNLAESVRASDAGSELMTRKLVNKAKLGAEEIARRVYKGVVRRDFHILPHADSRRLFRLKRLLPFRHYRALMLKQTQGMMRDRS